jgi:LAS superfamily LD-carboxypeptidase LdcB
MTKPRTFPYGYNGARLTLAQMRKRSGPAKIDPEMWRRLAAMMNAAADNGVALGIGGSFRPASAQLAGFLDRHSVVKVGGCCKYDGKRYALKKGKAHMAPPGLSYHEATTPAGDCLAVDMVSSDGHRWMNANCHRFGLTHFANVNREPWHVQPSEIPAGRSKYNPKKHHPLKPFKLP